MQVIYEVFISILACVAVVFSIIDLSAGLSPFLCLFLPTRWQIKDFSKY